MKTNPMKAAEEARHEAQAQAAMRELREDPEWENVHYTRDAKDNPRLEAMNQGLAQAAKKKAN